MSGIQQGFEFLGVSGLRTLNPAWEQRHFNLWNGLLVLLTDNAQDLYGGDECTATESVGCSAGRIPAWATAKHNTVSVDRTLLSLDECLSLIAVSGSNIDEWERSARSTALRNVSGYSLGGFGLSDSREDRGSLLEAAIVRPTHFAGWSLTILPADKTRHVSGLGIPEKVLHAVSFGVDLFDSKYPHMLTMGGFAMTFPYCMEERTACHLL